MGEWSTLLLNIRVIYRLLDRTETAVSALFALTFFVTRVAIFGALVLQIFSQRHWLRPLLPTPLLVSYFALLPALYGLNLFWFAKIVQGVVRVLQGGDDGSSDGYSRDDDAKQRDKRR